MFGFLSTGNNADWDQLIDNVNGDTKVSAKTTSYDQTASTDSAFNVLMNIHSNIKTPTPLIQNITDSKIQELKAPHAQIKGSDETYSILQESIISSSTTGNAKVKDVKEEGEHIKQREEHYCSKCGKPTGKEHMNLYPSLDEASVVTLVLDDHTSYRFILDRGRLKKQTVLEAFHIKNLQIYIGITCTIFYVWLIL